MTSHPSEWLSKTGNNQNWQQCVKTGTADGNVGCCGMLKSLQPLKGWAINVPRGSLATPLGLCLRVGVRANLSALMFTAALFTIAKAGDSSELRWQMGTQNEACRSVEGYSTLRRIKRRHVVKWGWIFKIVHQIKGIKTQMTDSPESETKNIYI